MGYGRAARREGIQLAAMSWQERLEQCQSEGEVVQAVREYVALLTPEEIASLPKDFIPGRITDGDDISAFAVQLLIRETRSEGQNPLLHKLAHIFGLASVQLSKVVPATAANQDNTNCQSA